MITFGMFDITNLRKKFYKKIEEPCEQKLQGALFLAIENKSTFSQLSIPAPILTTMTKSEPVISTLEKNPSKVSFFIQCIRKQLITLQNFNIQTCFSQLLWFFSLKC